ncbi:unnamed protein product [Toxocara canis]|nr:unnamed protein product [Toxocara canis]
MTRRGETKRLQVIGEACNWKRTFVRVYTDTGRGRGKDALISSSFLDGVGVLNYVVGDDLQPRMKMRAGVACGFGDCGHG